MNSTPYKPLLQHWGKRVANWIFGLVIGTLLASPIWLLIMMMRMSWEEKPHTDHAAAIVKQINLAAWQLSDAKAQNVWLELASSIVREHGPFTNEDGSVLILLPAKP